MTAIVAKSNVALLETPSRQTLSGASPQTKPKSVVTDLRRRGAEGVSIVSIATAVPKHRLSQQAVTARAAQLFPHLAAHGSLYANTGIEARYCCEHADWYHAKHSWEERATSFSKHAVDLLEQVAYKATECCGLTLREIDAIVVNTITGVSVPSLDALLINRLDFREDVERLPIFGFGCGGGVAGLARAAQLARARSGTNVLFLSVDLCSLCLRPQDDSVTMFVATALFGDGAAGVVLRHEPRASGQALPSRASIVASGEHFWRQTKHIMGWDIKSDGFGVVLSPELTQLLRHRFQSALDGFLAREGLTLKDFDGFLFHPGGRKVLECLASMLNVTPADLAHSWAVLKNYGNMSSATGCSCSREPWLRTPKDGICSVLSVPGSRPISPSSIFYGVDPKIYCHSPQRPSEMFQRVEASEFFN